MKATQLYKNLNITATTLSLTAILLALLTLHGWLYQLIHSLYPNLHPFEADKKYWSIEEVVYWLIPVFFLASLVLSIVSISIQRSRYGVFLVIVGAVSVLLCVLAYLYVRALGMAFGNP